MTPIWLPGFTSPVLITSILWLEGDASYTRIHHVDGRISTVTKPLNYFVSLAGLIRVHRSAIVNSINVQRLAHTKGRSGYLYLANAKVVVVSRAYLPQIISLFPQQPIQEKVW